jgi:hypothetical protein
MGFDHSQVFNGMVEGLWIIQRSDERAGRWIAPLRQTIVLGMFCHPGSAAVG